MRTPSQPCMQTGLSNGQQLTRRELERMGWLSEKLLSAFDLGSFDLYVCMYTHIFVMNLSKCIVYTWQSRIEIEYYSVAYFESTITEFDVL